MAFPFCVYNIAYLAAGFKSRTHNCGESQIGLSEKNGRAEDSTQMWIAQKCAVLLPSYFLSR